MVKLSALLFIILNSLAFASPTICTIGQTEYLKISHPEYRPEIHYNSIIALGENRFLTSAYFLEKGLKANLELGDKLNKKIKSLGYDPIQTFIECPTPEGDKIRINIEREDLLTHPSFDQKKNNNNNFAIIEIIKNIEVSVISTLEQADKTFNFESCRNVKAKEQNLMDKSDQFTLCKIDGVEYLAGINIPNEKFSEIRPFISYNVLTPFINFFKKDRVDFLNYNKELFYTYRESFLNRSVILEEYNLIINQAKDEISRGRKCISHLESRWPFKPKKKIAEFSEYIDFLEFEVSSLKKAKKPDLDKAKKFKESFKDFNYKRCPDL